MARFQRVAGGSDPFGNPQPVVRALDKTTESKGKTPEEAKNAGKDSECWCLMGV